METPIISSKLPSLLHLSLSLALCHVASYWVCSRPLILGVGAQYKQPSNFTFYLHNTILDPTRYNNTDFFNSVHTVQPTGFANPWNFGIMATFEDPLTEEASNTSLQVGVARGLFMYDSQSAFVVLQAFTAMINTTEYQGSLQIFGQLQESLPKRLLSVIGGTGDFFLARGLATCELILLDTTSGPTKWTLYFELDLYYY